MNRRRFIAHAVAGAVATRFLARPAWASQECGAVQQTANGPIQVCTAGVQSIDFQPVQFYQQQSEWCWAACISMLFAYYGHPVSQRRIVGETWGQVVNMPGQPNDILRDLNKSWTDDKGKAFHSVADTVNTNNFSAVKDLQQNRPLIIGALGHAMVLTALTGMTNLKTGAWQISEAHVRDPWPGRGGLRMLTPQEWYQIRFAVRIRVS